MYAQHSGLLLPHLAAALHVILQQRAGFELPNTLKMRFTINLDDSLTVVVVKVHPATPPLRDPLTHHLLQQLVPILRLPDVLNDLPLSLPL